MVAFLIRPAAGAEKPVEPEDLRAGLVTTFRDGNQIKSVEVILLEPTVAVALQKGEAAHPRLQADGGTIRWEGHLNVLRAGVYRFSANLRGKLRVSVAGKEVLAAEINGPGLAWKQGPPARLEAGVHSFAAELTRLPGAARVELLWEAPHFRREPLPYDVLGHLPAASPDKLADYLAQERGRFLVEERNCMGCHRVDDRDHLARGLLGRRGPDLSKVGERVHPGWLYRWLEAPDKIRHGTAMPAMFPSDENGMVERYAVAHYLAALGGPIKIKAVAPKSASDSVKRGQQLFASIGCSACHGAEDKKAKLSVKTLGITGARTNYPLKALGSKTTLEKLAAYLENPLAVDPAGRMPHMLLNGKDARDLAQFLCADADPAIAPGLPEPPAKERMLAAFKRVDSRAEEMTAFQRLPATAQWNDLGKRLVIDKGCNNCHTIAPGGKGFANMLASATFDEIKSTEKHHEGCLAEVGSKRGKAPDHHFDAAERLAARRFLAAGTAGAGTRAPAYSGRVALERFNCLACHVRNGEGGLSAKVTEQLRKFEKAENAEAVAPPPLTGVGHKLRAPWIKEVMLRAGRARPWMGLRMPQFGDANVGALPEVFAAMDGRDAENKVHQVPITAAKVQAGRQLVGKQVFGCISCHDIAGIPNTGTRGPDLALMSQRVQYDWYRRWLEQALRMQPGTRMPTIFPDGKSTSDKVLGGSADAQADAMWAYLSLGPSLHLPEGLEPPRGLIVTVRDRPVLLRTFMPDAGNRAVAVGFPGGVSTTFDAQTCRLAYGWTGNFLDASPVWDGRGGAPAKVLGSRFWTAPHGFPWAASDSNTTPDFEAQAKNPAYGANPPEGKVFAGKRLLRFEGYGLDRAGVPTFRYRMLADSAEPVEVSERAESLRSTLAVGLRRHFILRMPRQHRAWLLAGESDQPPRLLDMQAKPLSLDLKSGSAETGAAGRMLALPQGGGRLIVLVPTGLPTGTAWQIQRKGGRWQAVLSLPLSVDAGTYKFDLNVWSPYRDDAGLLKELVPVKE
jgi:mono/diheme cytochrome c family protein